MNEIKRYQTNPREGLSSSQVNERIQNNLVNYNKRVLYIFFAFENSKMFENLNKISNL